MDISTVKIVSGGYLVNGSVSVPVGQGNRHYKLVQEWIAEGNTPDPELTAGEIAANERAAAARARASDIAAIKVIAVQGKEFNGNEAEQSRLAVAITLLDPGESIEWVLADETVANLTREDLKDVLVAVGRISAAIRASNR